MNVVTWVGIAAALCTTGSYFPQLKKCWETGHAEDLSLWMFSVLSVGIALWIAYGVMQGDVVIIGANSVSLCCLAGILYFQGPRGIARTLLPFILQYVRFCERKPGSMLMNAMGRRPSRGQGAICSPSNTGDDKSVICRLRLSSRLSRQF